MKQFKDQEKRTWDVIVNVGTAKRVRDISGVNLFNLFSEEAEKVFGDPITFVDVLYALCKPQIESRKMTDVEFGEALTGDAIEEAATALLEEVADFFPERRRKILRTTLAKAEEQALKMEADLTQKLEEYGTTSK